MGKADAIIDYLILKGPNALGELPTQLTLMKLLFFVEGWAQALLGRSLVNEPIRAWQLGPVVVSQRARLSTFGASAIPQSFVKADPCALLERDEIALIDEVWRRYAVQNPGSLVGLTHLRGSPWHIVRKMHGIDWNDKSTSHVIPSEMIGDYFRDLYERARRWRIDRAVRQHEDMSAEELGSVSS